ncbi:FAD-dependent monooxygenase [Streptomyces sp. HPF1205]|uniref:FAD-dependent monooxygenase n=1 Tax=Streptomyces sp. HPF1205 TaxID=2873262 RepID=UPI001CEDF2DD|nr:FAD-dependent monooxygenase [Streptomyces sp. HPF1205]
MSAGEHAIVVGGSIAGLLAARVLSDFYSNVTVVERDPLTDDVAPRKAVPQGHHVHALLARGQQILERLLPGLRDELVAAGAPVGDFGTSVSWYFDGRMMSRTRTSMTCVAAGRPLLEQRIRRRVTGLPNVAVMDATDVTDLLTDPGRTRVTGVRVAARDGRDGGSARLEGDLVVDAAGRGSQLARWLTELGRAAVDEEVVRVGLGYVTQEFHSLPDFDPIGDGIGMVPVATPGHPRGAVLGRLPGRYALALTGIRGDHPPRDREGFLAFAATVPVPEIHRAVAAAEPLGPPHVFHYTANVRHRYERMKDFPDGLVVVGDAFSTFNPMYGQGMTVAALAAELLRRHIERYAGVRPAVFLRELSRAVDAPWGLAVGADLGFPHAEGHRSLAVRLGNTYVPRLQRAAAKDPVLARAFLRVTGLVDPPSALFRPGVVARALAGR